MNTKQDTQATAGHTPGEWKINETWGTIESQDGKEICAIHASDESGRRLSKTEAQANARLIASAPTLKADNAELIAALEIAYSTLEKSVHFETGLPFWRKGGSGYAAMLDARAAIARAKGVA